jgi:hypothetical protein
MNPPPTAASTAAAPIATSSFLLVTIDVFDYLLFKNWRAPAVVAVAVVPSLLKSKSSPLTAVNTAAAPIAASSCLLVTITISNPKPI